MNFSNKLGGKIGINLSKESIFGWFQINKNKLVFPWIDDLQSKRLINLLYNYEYINSSSKKNERKNLDLIIFFHLQRILFDFNSKKISEISINVPCNNYGIVEDLHQSIMHILAQSIRMQNLYKKDFLRINF